jgi:mannose-6-phosphate isomerase
LEPVLLLAGDNFTPASRTPWGGGRVAAWKRALGYDAKAPLGESWEVSFGPELPGRVQATGQLLSEAARGGFLGDEGERSALLVKLLDAGAPLSVQIHPHDDDPHLGADESGKPECWYVAARDPGAVIHFGLAEHATPAAMRAAIEGGDDVSRLLRAIAVEPGDFFVVPPGTPHAIGAGVTVVEPQKVEPGKRGVTYRYWDWNRRYDAAGRLDPSGAPRALQVDDALRVTDWSPSAPAWRRHGAGEHRGASTITQLSAADGRDGSLASPIEVARLVGTGKVGLAPAGCMRALTVIEGEVAIGGARARRGESLLLAAGHPFELCAEGAVALVCSTPRRLDS